MSFTFNNNVTGGNTQINQGQNVTATQNVGDSAIKLTFASAIEVAKEKEPEAVPVVEQWEESYGFAEEFATDAPLPVPKPEDESKIASYLEKLAPYKDTLRTVVETAKAVWPPASGYFAILSRVAKGIGTVANTVGDLIE